MSKPLIFIACGQQTEKQVGKDVEAHIKAKHKDRFDAFFAENLNSGDEIVSSIFSQLHWCARFLAIMHGRGKVIWPEGELIRGSVWIYQELCILMFRKFLLRRPVSVRVFLEKGITHEGLTQYLMVHPEIFENSEDIIEGVDRWLTGPEFDANPVGPARVRAFNHHVRNAKDEHWRLLLVFALREATPENPLMAMLAEQDYISLFGNPGPNKVQQTWGELVAGGVVERKPEKQGSWPSQFAWICPAWRDLVVSGLKERGEMLV